MALVNITIEIDTSKPFSFLKKSGKYGMLFIAPDTAAIDAAIEAGSNAEDKRLRGSREIVHQLDRSRNELLPQINKAAAEINADAAALIAAKPKNDELGVPDDPP